MSSSNLKVLFYLRKNRLTKDGKSPIMVRVTLDGEISQFSSKLNVAPEMWDAKLNRVKGKGSPAIDLNLELDKIRVSIADHFRKLSDRGSVSVEKLRNAFMGVSYTPKETLFTLFDKQIKDIERSIEKAESISIIDPPYTTSPKTLQKYKVTRRRLTEFMKKRYKLSDIDLCDINNMFILDFENYLRVEGQCAVNTTAKFMRLFKRIIIIAKNNGWITRDPFADYKIHLESVDRGYLTQEEVEAIMRKRLTIPRLELVRDIFVFAIFTGLSYIDVRNLTKDNIRTSFDGNLWIMTKRQKTNIQSNILLLDVPRKIIEKYDGCSKKGMLLPIFSNQKMNGYLKEIADMCGVDKKLTYHLARHTFATTITLSRGVPIETVSKMLGHTNIRTTQIYAKITDSKVSDDMSELENKLNVFNAKFVI